MHRMHRIFPGYGQLLILSTRKPAPDRRPNRHLVHKPFVLSILCILCIHVQKMSIPCAVAGPSGWSRWPRLCQDLCGRDARAPGWTSSHDLVTPRSRSSPESASRAAASRPANPVHPVHPCSIDSPSRWICPVAGAETDLAGNRALPRGQAGFQSGGPPNISHPTVGRTPPGSAGVPPASLFLLAAQRYLKDNEAPRRERELLQRHAPPLNG